MNNSAMLYSVDTSAMIDAWHRWYSPDTHPTLWERIDEIAREGRFFISDMVLSELGERDDDLFDWCRTRHDHICQVSTVEIQLLLAEVVNAHPNLGAIVPGGKNFADPYVIAVARYRKSLVLSHENRTGNMNGPKIPDVCRVYHIRPIKFPDLIREEGWKF